jgi:AcrR family transcriptional regulator
MPLSTESRRDRERSRRHQQILDQARAIAETQGWDRVTTRRLAEAIEYTQPVLYGHFPGGKVEIMNAVALQGFTELAQTLSATSRHRTPRARIRAAATGYLEFAAANPAVYQAMFALPINARFAVADSEPQLKEAFDMIVSALDERYPAAGADATAGELGIRAELFWSALHGVATLERDGRLRANAHRNRIEQLVKIFAVAG